ncbi:voltage-gated chloride channel family protein [Niabella yanshanensis]|uniref:Voltage-gated chloride channel family protein n=1 Tax=Niabella yanshanensis TaxID=577386 RepID=A0ABZ0W548_9BACT|nr:voltage-gated chloride channel family protein [Niabella yanshanensis]WQD37211.1 voltage-gated chloride channel family protein [Niabella yanshanensis]
MQKFRTSFHPFLVIIYLVKWTLWVLPVSLLTGSLVALFLWLLETVIEIRFHYNWLLYFLPLAGIVIHFLYRYSGKNAEAGNNLIIDEIHKPDTGVPLRMAPLVLFSTIITHLFGGSAGREGTAVQMGGSLSHFLGRHMHLSKENLRILLMTGIAGGFGAVFGTPVAGAIFALEVLVVGKLKYNALLPCLMASILSNIVCSAWGIHHTNYQISFVSQHLLSLGSFGFNLLLMAKAIGAGIAFGLAAYLFVRLSHAIKRYSNQLIKVKWLIPVTGGLIIIVLSFLISPDYLSLSVSNPDPGAVSIVTCFKDGGAKPFSWLWKILFTTITLGMGFKGGEVTPLFFIGAALGNTIAMITGAPVDLMAGLGFIAVFAGATNTPLACTIMGAELFGADNIVYYAIACFTAYYFSGHTGIYGAQKNQIPKMPGRA